MSKTCFYENLLIVKGDYQHTGSNVGLKIDGTDRKYWNVGS